MCGWWNRRNQAQRPVEYVRLPGDRWWSLEQFIDHFLRTRGVQADAYNRTKLQNAIQQFPGERPPPLSELETYLDQRYRSSIQK